MIGSRVVKDSLKVEGDLITEHLIVKGYLEVDGRLEAKKLIVYGTVKAKEMQVIQFENYGTTTCRLTAESENMKNYGTFASNQNLCKEIYNEGKLMSNCTKTDKFHGYGELHLGNLMVKESFEFLNKGDSEVETITAETVHIMKQKEYKKKGFTRHVTVNTNSSGKIKFFIKIIQADTITITEANVDRIVGNDVWIKNACIVGELKYKNTYSVEESSLVHSLVRGV